MVGAVVYYYVATCQIHGEETNTTKRYGIAYFCGCILGFFYHICGAFCSRNKRYVYEKVDDDEEQELTSVNSKKYMSPSTISQKEGRNRDDENVVSDKESSKDTSDKNNNTGGGTKKKTNKTKKSETAISASKVSDGKEASKSKS